MNVALIIMTRTALAFLLVASLGFIWAEHGDPWLVGILGAASLVVLLALVCSVAAEHRHARRVRMMRERARERQELLGEIERQRQSNREHQ